jgi:hypothetical protein
MAVQPLTTNPTEKGTMKSQIRIAALFAFTALCLALAAIPASAQGIKLLYDNGPYSNPRQSPVRISQQYVVSNEVQMKDNGFGGQHHYMNSFQFVVWVRSWDKVRCVDWSIDKLPFGALSTGANLHYGGGTACPPTDLSAVYLFQQESPKGTGILWNIYEVTVSFPDVKLPPETLNGCPSCTLGAPTFYLTLKNNPVSGSVYMYWDQNAALGALGNNGMGGTKGGVFNTAYLCDTSKGACNVGNSNVTAINSDSFSIVGYDQ